MVRLWRSWDGIHGSGRRRLEWRTGHYRRIYGRRIQNGRISLHHLCTIRIICIHLKWLKLTIHGHNIAKINHEFKDFKYLLITISVVTSCSNNYINTNYM